LLSSIVMPHTGSLVMLISFVYALTAIVLKIPAPQPQCDRNTD